MNINDSRSLAHSSLALSLSLLHVQLQLGGLLEFLTVDSRRAAPLLRFTSKPLAASPRTHPSVIKMPLGLFTPRAVKAECWFCQQVNALPTSSQPVETAPLFPLEGTPNNFTCRFCGNRNLRDMVSTVSHAAICGTYSNPSARLSSATLFQVCPRCTTQI